MPFSHHSHSGQFCGHASNTLEEIILFAISKNMTTFCLTEHIPREPIDFYPEEQEIHTQASLTQLFDDFYHEARRLQERYASKIQIFIGFECEWIRPSSMEIIKHILGKYSVDLFVGSVHHVHTVPIDFDTEMYHKAREIAGGSDEQIYADYFDSQFDMLKALQPPLVGHFDLIRLKGDKPDRSFRTWPVVWEKIERNLKFIAEYGGVLELNTSSLRKGMGEAYPQSEICAEFKNMGGRFTLSDDSHGVEQVALNYDRAWSNNIVRAGITELWCLAPTADKEKVHDTRFPNVCWESTPVSDLEKHAFFHA